MPLRVRQPKQVRHEVQVTALLQRKQVQAKEEDRRQAGYRMGNKPDEHRVRVQLVVSKVAHHEIKTFGTGV